MKKNYIVVTGGAGFIGSSVVRIAVKKGYKVLNIDLITSNLVIAIFSFLI